MTKENDIAYLKANFTCWGVDVAERLKTTYEKKGMSFSTASTERLTIKLMEEVGEVSKEVFSGRDIDKLISEILDVSNMALLLYINAKELKSKNSR